MLIFALLLLGGVLAVVGDRLGTRIGKARLSFLRMRPRHTALVFTAITGSLISALSFAVLLSINARWRRGLFELGRIEESLWTTSENLHRTQVTLETTQGDLVASHEALVDAERSRNQAEAEVQGLTERTDMLQAQTRALQQTIQVLDGQRQQLLNEQEQLTEAVHRRDQELGELQEKINNQINTLDDLRRSIAALRRGDVAIASNESLAMAKVKLPRPSDGPVAIDSLLNRANQVAYKRLLPDQKPTRQIIYIPTSEVEKIARDLQDGDAWIVTIRSVNNVLLGEGSVLAFADIRPSRQVLQAGQILASTVVAGDEHSFEAVNQRLNLLLATARNRANQLGALNMEITLDDEALTELVRSLMSRTDSEVTLEAFSVEDSETGDPLSLGIRWQDPPPADTSDPDYD